MERIRRFYPVIAVAAAAACADQPVAPAVDLTAAPAFARAAQPTGACAADAAYTVADEGSLRGALAAARSGDVIAIDGTVVLTDNIWVETPRLTFTCASAGAGLTTDSSADVWALFGILATGTTIDGLVLDAGVPGAYAVYAVNTGVDGTASDLTFTNNRVACGSGCLFIVGAPRSVIADNHFEAEFAGTGIHLQGYQPLGGEMLGIDGTRIERNTVLALGPVGSPVFGAIRPRDGRAIVVADNVVSGPWSNGIGVAEVQDTRVERNRVTAARQFALFISSNPFNPISTSGSLFRANRLAGGVADILVRRACGNVLVGNVLGGGAEWPVVFEESTGANAFLGRGASVIDDGAADCDGDGESDSNQITGAGRRGSGGAIGSIVGDVMQTVGGHVIR